MTVEDIVRELVRDGEDALVSLARRAYEAGYREGLASRSEEPRDAAIVAPKNLDVGAPPSVAQADAPPAAPAPAAWLGSDDEDADIDEPDDDADVPVVKPIRASMSVGGLMRRIERLFVLDRFDVRLRIEDPRTGRQLKRGTRLSRYLKEGKA